MGFLSATIRNADDNVSNAIFIDTLERGAATLSDGTLVFLHRVGTDATILRLYWSGDNGGTWTLKLTVDLVGTPTNIAQPVGMCIDDDDNIHLATSVEDGEVFYHFLESTGSHTWSWNNPTNDDVETTSIPSHRLGVEVIGTTVIVCGIEEDGGTDATLWYRAREMGAMGDWGTRYEVNLPVNADATFGDAANSRAGLISIARDADNAGRFAIATRASTNARIRVHGFEIDLASGAELDRIVIDADAITGYRDPIMVAQLFSSAAGEWSFMGMTGEGSNSKIWFSRLSWAGRIISLVGGKHGGSADNNGGFEILRKRGLVYKDGRAIYWWIYTTGGYCGLYYRVLGVPEDGGGLGTVVSWDFHYENVLIQNVAVAGQFYHLLAGNNRNLDKVTTNIVVAGHINIGGYPEYFRSVTNINFTTLGAVNKPVAGSIQGTSLPKLNVTIPHSNVAQKPIFQIASDNTFTTDVKLVEADDEYFTTGEAAVEITTDVANQLSQDLWYIRAQAKDVFGGTWFYGAISSFTVAHAPATSTHAPSGGQVVAWDATNRFSWVFVDPSPGEAQTAYEIVLEKNGDGTVITDTGKITDTDQFADIAISGTLKGTVLRWKVKVWDEDDVEGPYSSYKTFQLNDPPSISITAPLASATNPAPLVTWTYSNGTAGAQKKFRVFFYLTGTTTLVHDSGWVVSATHSYTPPAPILDRNSSYDILVQVEDSAGVQTDDQASAVLATWAGPAQPTFAVDISNFDLLAYNQITWDGTDTDAAFVGWAVYRRPYGTSAWTLIGETQGTTDAENVLDFTAKSNTAYEYTVVQVKLLSGAEVESDKTVKAQVTPQSATYWLIDPSVQGVSLADYQEDPGVSAPLYHVTDEGFEEEYDEETIPIIGRGKKRDTGTRWGFNGNLSAQLRGLGGPSPRAERLALELIRASAASMYLRNPFGDLFLVNVGTIKSKRIPGVGTEEYMDIQVPYQETN